MDELLNIINIDDILSGAYLKPHFIISYRFSRPDTRPLSLSLPDFLYRTNIHGKTGSFLLHWREKPENIHQADTSGFASNNYWYFFWTCSQESMPWLITLQEPLHQLIGCSAPILNTFAKSKTSASINSRFGKRKCIPPTAPEVRP